MLRHFVVSAALLLPAVALAAPAGVKLSSNHAVTTFRGVPTKQTLPNWHPPKGKKAIINTLGDGNAYNAGNGWTISNPDSQAGSLQWFAYAIVPKKDATVTEIVEAVSFVVGTNSATVAMLADDNGSPGNVLVQKTVKNLETFGQCCGVADAKLKKGIPVKAGTTYWIAAILPKKSQDDTWDAWNFSTANTGNDTAAYYNGTWNVVTDPYAAFAVYGD